MLASALFIHRFKKSLYNEGRRFMKKRFISVFLKFFTTALMVVLFLALLINIFTLWSVNQIKQGNSVKFGYFSAIIGSGSMEPAISVNDLLLIKGWESYQAGDIITYVSPKGALVTHRIKEVLDNGYITQGDANNIADEEVLRQRVMGRVIFVMPVAGGIIDGLLSPVGIFILVCAFLLVWLIRRIRRDQNEIEDEEKSFNDIQEN